MIGRSWRALTFLLLALWHTQAANAREPAAHCAQTSFEGASYILCETNAAHHELRLFLENPATKAPWGQFETIDSALRLTGKKLAFGMNAGMYHQDRSPVGHYMENGQQTRKVISRAGPGNFGLLPNGVFCIREGRADVFETLSYLRTKPACRDATQSGPMLLINGKIHPRFLPHSTSRHIRNGVGTSANGQRVVFAISVQPVTFHQFARLFQRHVNVPQALYFDGSVSRLYAPEMARTGTGLPLGPIVGVVTKITSP